MAWRRCGAGPQGRRKWPAVAGREGSGEEEAMGGGAEPARWVAVGQGQRAGVRDDVRLAGPRHGGDAKQVPSPTTAWWYSTRHGSATATKNSSALAALRTSVPRSHDPAAAGVGQERHRRCSHLRRRTSRATAAVRPCARANAWDGNVARAPTRPPGAMLFWVNIVTTALYRRQLAYGERLASQQAA
jgi:hypothetical protein